VAGHVWKIRVLPSAPILSSVYGGGGYYVFGGRHHLPGSERGRQGVFGL